MLINGSLLFPFSVDVSNHDVCSTSTWKHTNVTHNPSVGLAEDILRDGIPHIMGAREFHWPISDSL